MLKFNEFCLKINLYLLIKQEYLLKILMYLSILYDMGYGQEKGSSKLIRPLRTEKH